MYRHVGTCADRSDEHGTRASTECTQIRSARVYDHNSGNAHAVRVDGTRMYGTHECTGRTFHCMPSKHATTLPRRTHNQAHYSGSLRRALVIGKFTILEPGLLLASTFIL
jgi:hypothetical protein